MKRDVGKFREWQRRTREKALAKQRATGRAPLKRSPNGTPMRKVSKSREREMRLYYEERAEWLKLPENSACAVCRCLGETPMAAVECHHSRGRIGRLLRDQRFWVPTCRNHRDTPHQRPAWAREMGLIVAASEWNTYPAPGKEI